MCGRLKMEGDFSKLKTTFKIPDDQPSLNFPPSWNVAPTDSLPIVRHYDKDGHRGLDLMRWGLVPYWAKDMKVGFANINAMAETVDTKPAYRDAFARRRCLVPIEAFYEWKKLGPKEKQPYAFALAGGGLMALAGAVGELEIPGRRVGAELHDRHHGAERAVRPDPRPDAGDPRARSEASLAGRDGRRRRHFQGADHAPLSGRSNDDVAGEHARRQRQEQRSVADRAGPRVVPRAGTFHCVNGR
jgi:SOS response associated peptidase (SRAP)